MAAGCACVAAGTGPIPEVVHHGADGWLVPPGDPAALADAVCHLLGRPDLRDALGREASRTAFERFDPAEAARRLQDIYDAVLGTAAGSPARATVRATVPS
jgi:glycosyltransferase involved in cell wall biosynthesis